MRKRVFGQPVTAIDVEGLRADTGPADFVRLCGALIGKALADRVGSLTLPEISERITVPDGGVDARHTTPESLSLPETGGLVGPGRTVFQFKYRDPSAANRSAIVQNILRQLRKEFPRVAPQCDRYILLTNIHLSGAQPRRLRDALVEGSPPFAGKPIVIWGAAEIALALNLTPHLRHLFSADGGLCTLDFAEEELKAAYDKIGWPTFVNREQDLAAIRAFVEDETARILQISGPKYVGKMRLVIEALRPFGTAVLWASSPADVKLDLFRDLDSSDPNVILVVDRCNDIFARELEEWAQARQHLKTVFIRTRSGFRHITKQTEVLSVEPFGDQDARKLLETLVPGVPFAQQSWAVEAAGGLPGLVLHVGALITDARISASTTPEQVQNRLGVLLEEQYLSGLTSEARQALEVASLLPVLGIEGKVGNEVDAVCRALNLSPGPVRTHLQTLERNGLVRRRGRFIEVVPPRLAEHLASRALTRPERILAELRLALDPRAFLRFLERFRSLPSVEVKASIARFLAGGEWFDDFDGLVRNAKILEILAPAAPTAALRCIERLLEGLSAEEVKARVVNDARRALVWALEDLALRSETSEGAARQLLALAEGENEKWANNATGVFQSLFHWQHPEVTVSLSRRLGVLQEGAKSASGLQRRIVATACGEAFKERISFMLHHPKGPAVPEQPYRPETWDEVRKYAAGILDLLISLTQDPDSEVKQTAISVFLNDFRPFVNLSLTQEGFHELGRKAFETIEEIGRAAPRAHLRVKVVSQLELTLHSLSSSGAKDSAAVKDAITRANDLLEQLTHKAFLDRLWRWIGPKSGSLEASSNDAEALKFTQGVAQELLRSPQLFEQHVDWLTGEEAEQRGTLFELLGREDKGGRLFQVLVRRFEQPFWPQAFSSYMRGWFESEPGRVESALDNLSETPALTFGILMATCWLPASTKTADRLLRLAANDTMPKVETVQEIARSAQWDQFTADEAERLFKALDDGTPEIRSFLLFPFLLRILRGAEITASLRQLAWSFLTSTFPVRRSVGPHAWDSLAAKLAKGETGRVLSLIENAISKQSAADQQSPLDHELPLVWGMLKEQDRPGLLSMLLRLALNPSVSHWIHWELAQLINPSQDHRALLDFARDAGPEGARLVALNLDADKPQFWELARDLIVGWGDDNHVKQRLLNHLGAGSWSGTAIPMINARIEKAKGLLRDSDPRVAAWAQQAVSLVEEWRSSAEREDREEWIWDYKIPRSELEAMMQRKDSPERLWAISRLLKDAPKERVLELLTPDDILDALPRMQDLDERTRQMWEEYARHWSGSH